jgi:hypothetical protein
VGQFFNALESSFEARRYIEAPDLKNGATEPNPKRGI